MERHSNYRLIYEEVAPATLKPNEASARKHPDRKMRLLNKSIAAHGILEPIVVDEAGLVLSGNARLKAAIDLGFSAVPIVRALHLTEVQKRAFIIAANRFPETGTWDRKKLGLTVQELIQIASMEEMELTGLELPDIDILIAETQDVPDALDELPAPLGHVVSQVGDIWTLGPHRIICGDALDNATFSALLGDQPAHMSFSDGPYNVPILGHAGGKGAIKHPDFVMGCHMSQNNYRAFLKTSASNIANHSQDGSIHYFCIDWRHMGDLSFACDPVFGELKSVCVWEKSNGGMGALYRSQHELVFVYKLGAAQHVNNIELGRHGRNRTNIWKYPGVNSFRKDRMEELAMHPTVKPVELVADAILDCSKRGTLILDAFGGSGTTLIAAEKTARHARIIELAPKYVDVAVRRWEKVYGGSAVHAATGETFAAREARTEDF